MDIATIIFKLVPHSVGVVCVCVWLCMWCACGVYVCGGECDMCFCVYVVVCFCVWFLWYVEFVYLCVVCVVCVWFVGNVWCALYVW